MTTIILILALLAIVKPLRNVYAVANNSIGLTLFVGLILLPIIYLCISMTLSILALIGGIN